MKFINKLITTFGVVTLLLIAAACTKNFPRIAVTDSDNSTSTMVQIFDATVKSTRNYVYVDAIPVSGATFAFGGVFPGTGVAFKVKSGIRSFAIRDTLGSSTQVQLAFSENMQPGKSYTIFTYDSLNAPKQATVLNNIVIPKDTTCMLRFANFIYNTAGTGSPNVDVYSFRRGTSAPVFTNVAPTQATGFIPYASALTDTLYVYPTGATSPLITKALVTSLTPQRSYTSVYCGSYTGTRNITTFATY